MSPWRDASSSSRSRKRSAYFSRPWTSGSAILPPQYSSASWTSSRTSRSRRERWSISCKIASREGRRRSACSTVNTFVGSSTVGTPAGFAGMYGAPIRDPMRIPSRRLKNLPQRVPSPLPEPVRRLRVAGRGHHHPELRLGLLDGPRLQPAVRVDVQLLRGEDLEGPLDPVPDHFLRFDDVAVDVDDAERDLLPQGLPPEPLEEVEPAVAHLEVEVVDRELVEVRVHRVVIPVARVGDRLRREPSGDDPERLHDEVELVRPRGEGGLVDLDHLRARALQVPRLLVDHLREREGEVLPGRVVLVEGPVHHRVRAREHPLQRALREPLRPPPPLHRDRTRPLELPDDDGLLVVPVPVGPDEPAHLASAEVLREVRRHVPAVLFAIDEEVDPDLLLERDPLLRRPLLEGTEGLVLELPLRVLRPRLREVCGLREAPDARREEAHSPASTSFAVSDTRPSFSRARPRGRNSRPFAGEMKGSSRGTFPFRRRAAFARARGSSRRVFLASTRPRVRGILLPVFVRSFHVASPCTRSRPRLSIGRAVRSRRIPAASPKNRKRQSQTSPFSAAIVSTPSFRSGISLWAFVIAGSSTWIRVAPASRSARTSCATAAANSRTTSRFGRPSTFERLASVYGPVTTALTPSGAIEEADRHSSTRAGPRHRIGPRTTGSRQYALVAKDLTNPV